MLGAGRVLHLSVRKHWLSVRVTSGLAETEPVEGTARVAVRQEERGQQVVAIGEEADAFRDTRDVTIHDAFCHPRVLIGGFDEALLVAREFLRRACGGKKPPLRFRLVIYIMEELESGLTDMEERAFQELGLRLGASTVSVHSEPIGNGIQRNT